MKVEIIERSDRGFHQYGQDSCCSYGTFIRVYESSAAVGPHLWLSLQETPELGGGKAVAHLNREQAEYLISRIQTWVDEIPARWGVK